MLLLACFRLRRLSSATMDEPDHKDVLILVAGNTAQDKSGIVESLTKSGDWDQRTTADVRILTCQSTGRVVVDTTPLVNIPGKSPTAIARRWISRNGLRRILVGKLVVVVCIITCTIRDTCKWEMFSYSNCWVDVFGLIFKEHKVSVMMLVNTEGIGEVVPGIIKSDIEHFVVEHEFPAKNITYSNLRERDDSVSKVISESIRLTRTSSDGRMARIHSLLVSTSRREGIQDRNTRQAPGPAITPFLMEEASSERGMFEPWGPERVILFGRTGSGKSTLAQMLTLGTLDPHNRRFASSSGIRGGTDEMEHGEGRGWYVLDTPGFGEPKGPESTISTQEAEKTVKRYIRRLEGTFSHYVFVVKKSRFDQLDERLWKFFLRLFGEEINQHFTVVVSGADDEWVQENIIELKALFKGCESFLNGDFPAIDDNDEELESEYQVIREESLLKLEENLALLNRADMHCSYGKNSKMHVRNERDRANVDMKIEKDLRIKFLTEGANACFALGSFISLLTTPLSELTSLLTVDDNIALLPG